MLDIGCLVPRGWSCALANSFGFWLKTVEFAEKVKWFGSINFLSILSVMILMWTVMMQNEVFEEFDILNGL